MKLSANIRDGGPGLYLYRNDQKRIIGTFKFTAEYLIFMGSNIWYVTLAKVCRVGEAAIEISILSNTQGRWKKVIRQVRFESLNQSIT